jgi:hypothetical protein
MKKNQQKNLKKLRKKLPDPMRGIRNLFRKKSKKKKSLKKKLVYYYMSTVKVIIPDSTRGVSIVTSSLIGLRSKR